MIITLNVIYRIIIGLLGAGMIWKLFKSKSFNETLSYGIVFAPLIFRALGIK